MTADDLRYFRTSEGERLLEAAVQAPKDPLARIAALRKSYPPERCRAAVSLLELRTVAAAKFSRAEEMVFDRDGLEQASSEAIARHRAVRYRGTGRVADLCCGVGSDTVALAVVSEVTAVDVDPCRAAITRWNARVHGAADRVTTVCADVTRWLPPVDALFIDPARRSRGRRHLDPGDYRPPLDLPYLRAATPHIGVKVAPGIPYGAIPNDCEVEFISHDGACKEAVLWLGDLGSVSTRRATLLPSGDTLVARDVPAAPVRSPGAVIYEPDRAVIRAHLIDQLAGDLGAWKLAPDVAYLSSADLTSTPFARAYGITETFPFSIKRLQGYLDAHEIGRLDIKKRRFPLTPDQVRARLKLEGDGHALVFLTRIAEKPMVIVCWPAAVSSA